MDRRIRSVEFKKTAYNVKATTEETSAGEEVGNEPAGSVYSPTLPNPWVRVKRAYFHPSNVVAGDRFEILSYDTDGIESISGSSVEKGDYVSISSIGRTSAPVLTIGRTYFKNTNSSNPYYTCRAHGTPSWSLSSTNTRESLKFNGAQVYAPLPIPGDTLGTVKHTYLFSSGSTVTSNSIRIALATRALIASHSATTTTATLTISGSSHHYTTNDIIDVNDLPEAYRGIDGLFKVKSVTSNTISYDFDTPLSAAIPSATASSGTYIYSVAQKYVRVGSTWFDTVNDNKVYYWNGLRYQVGQVAGLQNDGSAPNPPTNLVLSTTGYNRGTDGSPRSRVDLSWTAPTQSANGKDLDDLLGYKIRISETGYSNWRDTRDLNGRDTSETITGLDPNKQYYFRVTAYDSFGNESTGLDGTIVTGLAALSVEKPSAPVIPTPRLGIVQVSWDGKDYNGAVVPIELINFIEVHGSTTSGFTPGSGTLLGKIYSKNAPAAIPDLTYNATYYFKLVAVDKNGNSSDASTQTTTQIRPLVDTDIIGKVLNGANIVNGSITASEAIIGETITGALIRGLTINAGHIETNSITTDRLRAGTMTGFTIRTSDSSTSVTLSAADNALTIRVAGTVAAYLTGVYDPIWDYGALLSYSYTDVYSSNFFVNVDTTAMRGPGNVSGAIAWGSGVFGYLDLYADTQIMITADSVTIGSDTASITDVSGALRVAAGFSATGQITAGAAIVRSQLSGGGTTGASFTNNGSLVRTASSARYKQDIVDLSIDYEKILMMQPRLYRWIEEVQEFSDARHYAGFIAEELHELGLTDFVSYSKDNEGNVRPEGVYYGELTGALVLAIKHQNDLISEISDRLSRLEGQ
jgi:hypothetical protein